MGHLLLRLCGPMQSWGTQSRFSHRDTDLEPSKSGVVGLLCAAQGRSRRADISDIAGLKMGVRVDWPGKIERDYHTATNVARSGGGIKDCELSSRYYLADGCFLVALAGEDHILAEVQKALQKPVWQIYLGRKSFVPGAPVYLSGGVNPGEDLELALSNYPYFCRKHRPPPPNLRMEIEDENGDRIKTDQPLSYSARSFGLRHVKTAWVMYKALPGSKEESCICQG